MDNFNKKKNRVPFQMDIKKYKKNDSSLGFFVRHPVFANIIVIFLVAFIGLWIAYLSLKLFTRHGESIEVPSVENMSYTNAIEILHAGGLRSDIRDSIYNEDYKPGYVIEQFPAAGAMVKPGRKIFLYINAVKPREAIIDVVNEPSEDALKGYSYRQGLARLEELGFKNVTVKWIPGESDRIVRITSQGRPVKKMEKTPVTAPLVLEVYDGKLFEQADSLNNEEYYQYVTDVEDEVYDNQDNTFGESADRNFEE